MKVSDYKLLAVVAVCMAWKFEGGYDSFCGYDSFSELVEENGFQSKEIIDGEFQVLRLLSYRLMAPTSWKFLCLYKQAGLLSEEAFEYAYQVLSRALLCDGMVNIPPSRLAAAAIFLAVEDKDILWVSVANLYALDYT